MRIIVETVLLIILSIAVVIMAVVLVIVLSKNKNNNIDDALYDASKKLNQDTVNSVKLMSDMINQNQVNMAENQKYQLQQMENRLKTFSMENEQKLENIRSTVEKKLTYMQEDNNKQLENIRTTVDEKLQNTLENKLNKSFETVSKQLQQVYKGLGEMQNLAVGVGDLKKVLSNVKTRGILGEIQLSAILKEILSPEQYEENVATKKGSRNVVEFAIKLPADDDSTVYLPIDSKFPGDTYAKLVDAMNSGNKEEIEICSKNLLRTIKSEAKDIHDKYISPPNTTEFAIMFLPFEGLYAEVVNRGMVEVLQREYKVNVAGPSTMGALLNSLQLGFKTLAVQKRSAEVWQILNDVKREFDTFADVLEKTQTRLNQANTELDKLVGVRTRKIQSQLSKVQKLEEKN
ncbi:MULTISPECIES: DNA recombination protein RmuC [Ruminococcus]|uniref:DNA recombination protein RmuC n=1 Tax=Ruminococcus bovis TaxID=2564099 RepID=A0A4P8XUE2_9FIRM|nr:MULTISPECIES: DNA recombination protein RmuC [Ruminococcus]MEE3439825.1 DNA recombination protein RmuC [Ruminococcus sp.]QCT06242.1 DNA recombination protein RmuC [Ruminococcus bovis]